MFSRVATYNQHMSKITKLPTAAAKPVKQVEDKRTYLEKFLAEDTQETGDFDWSEVTRLCQADEQGNYIKSLDDPIEFTPRGRMQIRSYLNRHGIRRMPETYGELAGNWGYCALLAGHVLNLRREQPAHFLEIERRDIQNMRGDAYLAMVDMLVAGNIEGATAWHENNGTFEKNSKDPVLTNHGGD